MIHETPLLQPHFANFFASQDGWVAYHASHIKSRSRIRGRQHTSPALELSLNYLEELLRSLRGESLLVATLSYGLAVPISALREVRVRDVGIFEKTILIRGREYSIPYAIADDLREFFQERVCGSEASLAFDVSHSSSVLNNLLFSEGAFSKLHESSTAIAATLQIKLANTGYRKTSTCFDSLLQVLARLHRRLAASKKLMITSPLELFDKGPRIVRRGRGGTVNAYYLWRASRALVRR